MLAAVVAYFIKGLCGFANTLVLTSILVARAGHTSVWRTAVRTLLIGAGAMLLSMGGGELLS